MDDQNQNQPTQDQPVNAGATQATSIAPPTESASASTAKILTIPSNAMAKIKREERERGKKAVLAELDAQAKKAGFTTWEDMMKAATTKPTVQKTSVRPATQPVEKAQAATPAPTGNDRAFRRAEKERERALEEVRRLNRARATEEKRRKDAERRVQAMEAEMTLRTAAVRAGVQDVDYALELLRRKINGKSADELKTFSEDEFFAKELRSSHPYLYGVTEIPANTSSQVAPKDAPKPPAPTGKPTQMPAPAPTGNGGGSMVDARKLSSQEYSELLQRYGIRNPSLGV